MSFVHFDRKRLAGGAWVGMMPLEWAILAVGRMKLAQTQRGPLRGCLVTGDGMPLTSQEIAQEAGIQRISDAERAIESLMARGLW